MSSRVPPARPRQRWLQPTVAVIVLLAGVGTVVWRISTPSSKTGTEDSEGLVPPSRVSHEADAETVDPSTPFPEPPAGKPWFKALSPALHEIFRQPNSAERSKELQRAADAIAVSDMPEVLAYLGEFDREDLAANLTADLANRLMDRWAALNLDALADWTARAPSGTLRDDAISQVIESSARKDFVSAETWARALADPEARNLAIGDLARQQAINHPEVALRLLMDLPGDAYDLEKSSMVSMAATGWAHDHPDEAREWALKLEDSPMKTQVVAGIALSLAEKDPAAGGVFAVDEMPIGQQQSDTVVGVVQLWAQQDPAKAAAWVEQFAAGDMKAAAVRTLVAIWSQTDPGKAAAWVKSQSPP